MLAQDLGTRGITVNAVSPGPIDTDMLRVGVPEEVRVSLANSHPQKRIGTTADVEPVIAFLVREEAGWVNGESIMVSGVSGNIKLIVASADGLLHIQGMSV